MRSLQIASLIVLGVWALRAYAPAPAAIAFVDIAGRAGLRFVTENCPTSEKHQPETMPAGIALFDYDGDGLLDIYLVNGAEMPSLVKTGPKYYNRLFHNNGDGTFTDVTERAGVAGAGYGMGVAVGDYDNDGRPDLFLANVNGNQLFHNNGDGTFTDVTAGAGLIGAVRNGGDVVDCRWLVRLQQRRAAGSLCLELLQVGSQDAVSRPSPSICVMPDWSGGDIPRSSSPT